MLTGAADPALLARDAATINSWHSDPLVLGDVTVLQVIAEIRRGGRQSLLPPGLHPTDPSAISIQAWRIGESPYGSFSFVHVRLSCRSGVRARGLTTAAVASTGSAARGLSERFGYPCRLGAVTLNAFYDGAHLTVDDSLVVAATNATPLGPEDVQYTGTMNLAHTPSGLRLVQVEPEFTATRVDRLKARLERFDSDAWGGPLVAPYFVVAGSVAHARVEIPPVRFVCRPDVSATEGTERAG
ncbi:MAG: hypothetical protein AB7T37_00275 [Dehalococcoidia bacterium]